MVSEGDTVRAFNIPNDLWTVRETGVARDITVDGSAIRLPSGDTLLESEDRDGVFAVVSSDLVSTV